jgi:hypothetical protein
MRSPLAVALTTSTVILVVSTVLSCGLGTNGLGASDGGTDAVEPTKSDAAPFAEASPPPDARAGSVDGSADEDGRFADGSVAENDSATSPVDSSGGPVEAGPSTDAPAADAAGIVPEMCATCLTTSCTADYSTCLRDPQCFDLILCTDACIQGGGTAEDCGFSCLLKSDSGAATSEAETLVGCAESNCTPCITLGSL